MRIKGTQIPDCRYCENANINSQSEPECTLGLTKDKCKKYKYDVFRYEPQNSSFTPKYSKEDFEI